MERDSKPRCIFPVGTSFGQFSADPMERDSKPRCIFPGRGTVPSIEHRCFLLKKFFQYHPPEGDFLHAETNHANPRGTHADPGNCSDVSLERLCGGQTSHTPFLPERKCEIPRKQSPLLRRPGDVWHSERLRYFLGANGACPEQL